VYSGPYWIAGQSKSILPLLPHVQSLLTFSVDVKCACTVAKFCLCHRAVYIVAAFTFNFRLHCVNWYFQFCGDVTLLHVATLLCLYALTTLANLHSFFIFTISFLV